MQKFREKLKTHSVGGIDKSILDKFLDTTLIQSYRPRTYREAIEIGLRELINQNGITKSIEKSREKLK